MEETKEAPLLEYVVKVAYIPDNEKIAKNAHSLRLSAHLSLHTVSSVMGISHTFLMYLERGLRSWTPRYVASFNKALSKEKKKK